MARDNTLLLALAALLLVGGGGYVVYGMTRGLRNNNPGNIRYDGTAWDGLANPPQDDKGFCVFVDPVYGIRAISRVLTNYVGADGIAPTVTAIISRWAPPTENDTASYIADVAGRMGVAPDQMLDLNSQLPGLIAGIVAHENFINPYTDNQILQSISLA